MILVYISDTEYNYTVEALLNSRVLARSNHTKTTQAIVVNPIEITSTVQPDDSVFLTRSNLNSGLSPKQFKDFVNGPLHTTFSPSTSSTKSITILDLQPGEHKKKIEVWYQDEIVSKGSEMVSIPEPVSCKPDSCTTSVHADFSVDIYYPKPLDLKVDYLKIF